MPGASSLADEAARGKEWEAYNGLRKHLSEHQVEFMEILAKWDDGDGLVTLTAGWMLLGVHHDP